MPKGGLRANSGGIEGTVLQGGSPNWRMSINPRYKSKLRPLEKFLTTFKKADAYKEDVAPQGWTLDAGVPLVFDLHS